MIGRKQLIWHEINRRYTPTHLSYKKLQKETLCDIQLSSLIFLGLHINYLPKTFLTNRKFIRLDKNISQWSVQTDLKDNFIVYYYLRGPWIVKIVSYFISLALSTWQNGELLIAGRQRPLSFNKIRTTTTTLFWISNMVVPTPYHHSTTFSPQSLIPLS